MGNVKSAIRALAILEYLRQSQPATLGGIARGLNFPISSTFALLKTLTDSGYLIYSPLDKLYRPSYRVALLGESIVERPSLGDGVLQSRLHELQETTGETLIAGLQNSAYVQYIHVIAPHKRLLQRLPVGKMRLMAYNPMGQILLAQLDLRRATSIIRHNNANWRDEKSRQSEALLLAKVAKAGADGIAIGPGATWPNATIIAMAVRLNPEAQTIAVGIGGLNSSILPKLDTIISTMQSLLHPWLLGPAATHPTSLD
jgi:DNA-binding IclR family transcriptional regulator